MREGQCSFSFARHTILCGSSVCELISHPIKHSHSACSDYFSHCCSSNSHSHEFYVFDYFVAFAFVILLHISEKWNLSFNGQTYYIYHIYICICIHICIYTHAWLFIDRMCNTHTYIYHIYMHMDEYLLVYIGVNIYSINIVLQNACIA